MMLVPAEIPVTIPVGDTVPTAVFELLHTPPLAEAVSNVDAPEQTLDTPVIMPATGIGFTVITTDAIAPPQLLLIV